MDFDIQGIQDFQDGIQPYGLFSVFQIKNYSLADTGDVRERFPAQSACFPVDFYDFGKFFHLFKPGENTAIIVKKRIMPYNSQNFP